MGLEKTNVIDAAGFEAASNSMVLTIVDSWPWDEERQHLTMLQSKLNAYLDFVQSGQVYEAYPDSRDSILRIDIIGKYPIPQSCIHLLEKANEITTQIGVEVRHTLAPSGSLSSSAIATA